jgi:hypothetical protein
MLSDKYLWPVPELTLVHEVYKLTSFQEPVTLAASIPIHRALFYVPPSKSYSV